MWLLVIKDNCFAPLINAQSTIDCAWMFMVFRLS